MREEHREQTARGRRPEVVGVAEQVGDRPHGTAEGVAGGVREKFPFDPDGGDGD